MMDTMETRRWCIHSPTKGYWLYKKSGEKAAWEWTGNVYFSYSFEDVATAEAFCEDVRKHHAKDAVVVKRENI